MAKSWWDSFTGKEDASIMTKTLVDPMKEQVASKLAPFLTEQIGKGTPTFQEFAGAGYSKYSDFLKMNPEEWFKGAVADPTIKQFKEDLLPVIQEGYAGGLRGSGRFAAEDAGIQKLNETLSQGRYKAQVEIPRLQYELENSIYQSTIQSLPQYNPALQTAIQFLSEQTNTGKTYLSALDPGKEGWLGDFLKAGATVAGAVLTGGTSLAATAVGAGLGATTGSVAGSMFATV